MNENENNNFNEEKGKECQPEDTKAFNWEWSDKDTKEAKPAEAEPSESTAGAEHSESTAGAEPAESGESDPNEEPDPRPNTDDEPEPAQTNEEQGENECSHSTCKDEKSSAIGKKNITHSRTLPAACILSACSIILIVAFALSLMLGIFPLSGRESVIIGISELGQTKPDTEASPELLEDFLRSVVVVSCKTLLGKSTGSGVIFNENGYIITNYHVIDAAETIYVTLYGESEAVKATVIGYHKEDDVAVLKIDRSGLRAAVFADSNSVRIGEKVYAVGHPQGDEFSWSITQGIVSCPFRQLLIPKGDGTIEKKMNVVQTDASVNPGNSGGPLINVRGEIVGIVTIKRAEGVGMGFALPANGVVIDVAAIIANGHANNVESGISLPRPLVGITCVSVEAKTYYKHVNSNGQSGIEKIAENGEEFVKANPTKGFYAAISGVYVIAATEGFDSAEHLKKGDIITEVNGQTVLTNSEFIDIINKFNCGDKISVKYYRNGKYHTADLTLKAAGK